ncbi:MAG: Gldg family protein [Candidatus Kuenenbacteria bacterium]
MSNIYTILKKELRAYFYHPQAYILLVVFLAVSYFFYFRQVLLTGEASLRPLFSILPWVMMFFAPAICMGLIAREKDKGTFEVLSTQPIKMPEILVGKALGAFAFVMIAVLITLTIPLTLGKFGDFDWGVIFSQYLGTAFLLASFTAIGILTSSLTKNQVVSFIGAIGINFILIMAGFEMVTAALPYPFDVILKRVSILDHFYNIARGVIDLRDIIYFIVLILIFGFLAYLSLLKTKGGRVLKEYKKLTIAIVVVIAALLVNLGGDYIGGRIDLTKNNVYTLSQATKKILSNLERDIDISLVVSKEMPAQLSSTAQDTKDLLNDYVKAGKGKISLNIYYPDKDETASTKAEELGIPAIQFNIIAQDEFSTKKGYFGLAIESGVGEDKKQEAIPLIERIDILEYQLTGFIWNMVNDGKKKIGWLTGHGEKDLYKEMAYLNNELAKQYELANIDLVKRNENGDEIGHEDISEDLAVLVILGPKENLDETEMWKISTYLKNGGSALILADTIDINPQYMFATTTDSTINLLLNEWGVNINQDLIYDLSSHENVTFQDGMMNYILPYPFWARTIASADNNFLSEVKSLLLPWSSSISIIEDKLKENTNVATLFTTTEFGGAQYGFFNLDPKQTWSKEGLDYKNMAVAVQNDFDGKNSRLIIVGNTNFVMQDFAQNSPGNAIFMLNAIGWLAQDDILSSIRAKNLASAPLTFKSDKEKNSVKYFNLIGVPILVIAAGVIVMWRRKKRMRRKFGD